MDKQELIREVKRLTGEASLEQALDLLDQYTSKNLEKYDELHDQIVEARSQLSRTQKDQNAGVISFENAKLSINQVTRRILEILDELEKELREEIRPSGRKFPVLIIISALVIIMGAIVAVWLLQRPDTPEEPETPQGTADVYCSGFSNVDAEFRVLILPYYFIGQPLGSHHLVRLRLGALRDEYNIRLASEIYRDSSLAANGERYPASADEAAIYGENCKAELVIWGTEEPRTNENVIRTRYKFLTNNDSINLTKLKISDTGVDTLQTLSSILTEGALTGEIEQIIKYLFGLIKFEEGDYDKAIAALEGAQLETKDTSARLVRDWILFDSYWKKKDEDMALKALDQVLTADPENALARNNRAAIKYTREKYEEAAEDLEMANEKEPLDTVVLNNRLYANLAAQRVSVAKETANKLKEVTPPNRELTVKSGDIDRKITTISREQESVILNTNRILESNPRDMEALQKQAQAYLNLGNLDGAIAAANKILQQDARNETAYLILLKAYTKLNRDREVIATLRRARENRIEEKTLLEGQPMLQKLIEQVKGRIR